ncbi:MAG TPA: hypothetical protein VJW55_13065, partial [Candidatus Angelobacter sp.]|nr:hypothetical protein [Candidatus Angelobacter sp.]
MKYRFAINLIFLLACSCAPAACAENISVAQYRQQLHDLAQKVDALKTNPDRAGKLVAELPDTIYVTASPGEINVNFKPLKADLTTFSGANEEKRAPLLTRLQSYVEALNAAIDSYDKPSDLSDAHSKLGKILSRPEFNKVHGPSTKDAFLARIFRWLSRLLDRLKFGNSTFDVMRFLIYLLVGIAAIFLLIWTVRRLRRPQEDLPQREIIPFSPSARSWRAWLAEARDL